VLDMNGLNFSGLTPLQLASSSGHASLVSLIVDEIDVNVNIVDKKGNTALHHAVMRKSTPSCTHCVQELLAHNADPFIGNVKYCTALDLARHASCAECVRTIEERVCLWQGPVDQRFNFSAWAPAWLVLLVDRYPAGAYTRNWMELPTLQVAIYHSLDSYSPYFLKRTSTSGSSISVKSLGQSSWNNIKDMFGAMRSKGTSEKTFGIMLTLQTQNLFFRVETKTMEIGLSRILQDLPAAVMLACQRNSTCLSSVVRTASAVDGSATVVCIMCSEQPANTIIFPCQHKCACFVCLQAVYGTDRASCPMCLGPLTSIEHIG